MDLFEALSGYVSCLAPAAKNVFCPLGSCLDATREHAPGTGSGAHSHAKSWGATHRARAPST